MQIKFYKVGLWLKFHTYNLVKGFANLSVLTGMVKGKSTGSLVTSLQGEFWKKL